MMYIQNQDRIQIYVRQRYNYPLSNYYSIYIKKDMKIYPSGIPEYDNTLERPLKELYVRCKCGKEWEEHNDTGQAKKCKGYNPIKLIGKRKSHEKD